MEIVPISRFRERLSCTEIEVLCRAHALSLCSPRAPVSLTPRAQTWDFGWQASPALWTRVACHARSDTSDSRASSSQHWLGWSGDLVMDALALILPIWCPASSAKALVDDILLLSPGISRYCYLRFGQPQLLSNATSGYGFHATASRPSQLKVSLRRQNPAGLGAGGTTTMPETPVKCHHTRWQSSHLSSCTRLISQRLGAASVTLWSATHWLLDG